MQPSPLQLRTDPVEDQALAGFRTANPDLFKKDDTLLLTHLGVVISLLIVSTAFAVTVPSLFFKIIFCLISGFLWFSLINVTIHHHQTHHNSAKSNFCKKILDLLYQIAVPNAPKRLNRYTRAHLNHHARPFHETDVDHHYGTTRYLAMMKKPWTKLLYFLELTFVGGHVPGWEDDQYMNTIPLEKWTRQDYETMKVVERKKAVNIALLQWGALVPLLWLSTVKGWWFLSLIGWGWALPMLLIKNWAHFLGQFQHYDDSLRENSRSIWKRTKTYHFPGWINYLTGGEISGHFLHHLFPELPYYKVEAARKRLVANPELAKQFAIY